METLMMTPIDNERMKMIDDAIERKKLIVDGYPERPFTTEDNMMIFDCVYNLCMRKEHSWSNLLYEKYVNCLNQRVIEKVLPAVVDEQGTILLENLVIMWSEFKEFAQSVAKLFLHLDQFHVTLELPGPLNHAPKHCFCNLVCDKLLSKLQESTLSMVIADREGMQQMDRDLLRSVFEVFLELEHVVKRDYYAKTEQMMLDEANAFYFKLSTQEWFCRDTFSNYMRKVDRCFVQEQIRAEIYPREDSKRKLFMAMKYIFLERNPKTLAAMRYQQGIIPPEVEELFVKYNRLRLN